MHDYAGQGGVILAMIKEEDISTWEDKLKEGESYIMHNFKILKNRAQYRICDHPFKLLFIGAISIRSLPIANILAKVCVATEIATGRRTKKLKFVNNRVWSLYHSLLWKLWKNQKKDKIKSAKNHILGPGVGYAWERY